MSILQLIMISITITILAFFFYIIGHTVAIIFRNEVRHKVICGFFTYFTAYGIFTMPLGLLHVSWNVFFIVVTLLNALIVGFAGYMIVRTNKFPLWSRVKVQEYVKQNRSILIVLGIYFLLYLMVDFNLYWYLNRGAVWDQSYYAAKANGAINSTNILLINPKYGYVESPIASLVNSTITWELFWSYLSVLTGLTVNQISKVVLTPFIYVVVFFTFDIIFGHLKKAKDSFASRGYLAVFILFILYTTIHDGLQDEVSKLLYFPWYGNVLVSTLFVITTLFLFKRALEKSQFIILLFLQLIFYGVFSAGGMMYAAILYPFLIVYWYRNKKYKFKFAGIVTIISIIFFLILNVFYILSQRNVRWIELNRWTSFYQTITPIFIVAGFGVFLLYIQKKLTKFEKFFIGLIIFFLFILILEPSVEYLFEWYRFALHRFAVSIMFVFLMYGAIGYISIFRNNKKILIVGLIPCLLISQKNYDFFLTKNSSAIKLNNIMNVRRESNEVIQAADFFNDQVKKRQKPVYYCVFGSDAWEYHDKRFKTIYYEKYIDIGSMLITETKNVYESYYHTEKVDRDYTIDQFAKSNCEYLITDSASVQEYYMNKGGLLEYQVKSDILLHNVQIINIENVKE